MNHWLNYSLILLAYIPGIAALIWWKKLWSFPLLMMGFVGIFFFNALGSISVLNLSSFYWVHFDRAAVASEYSALLVTQAFLYYLVVGVYVANKNQPAISPRVVERFDNHFIAAGVILILALVAAYFLQTGTFLIFSSVGGALTTENAYEYRMKYVYGLKAWPIFNLGFVMLPTFIASYAFIRANVMKRVDGLFWISIVVCFASSLTMGSKGGLLSFVLSLAVAYVVCWSTHNQSPWKIFQNKKYIGFSTVSLVILVAGYFWVTPVRMTALDFLGRLWHRLFVTSTETIAAAISYSRELGFIGIAVFPNVRGLLPHQQANLSLVMHEYISLSPGGVNLPVLAEAFLVSGWPSVVLILSIVFGVLVVLQELALRFRLGIISLAFSAYYGYLAILLSVVGMFSTLFTFMYISALIFLTLSAALSTRFVRSKDRL